MDTTITDFVGVLRDHGLRVSPAESLDALRSLGTVGIRERETVRDTLRATLVKSSEDIETFDRIFDLYFSLRPTSRRRSEFKLGHDHDHGGSPSKLEIGDDAGGQPPESEDHSHEDKEPVDMRRFFDEERMRPSNEIHGDPDRMRLSMFAQEVMLNRNAGALDRALRKITHQLRVRRAKNIFNPGPLAPLSDAEELPLDISVTELQDFVDHLHDLEVDEALIQELTTRSEEILRGLPQLLEEMRRRKQGLEGESQETDYLKRRLDRLMSFSAAEERELQMAIRRMARQIHGAKTRRLHRDRVGRISVAHTLRQNLRYEGIPFEPVLRRRREQRPRLAVLCDVSLSTRNLARFWLHMIYQTQSLFSKVRTFVFVAEMAEVTQLFEEHPMNRAVEQIFAGKFIDPDVNSDFGRAAAQFRDEHINAVTRRTTVVILGDGRNNGKPPNVEALEDIAQRARQVIWITPEPRWGWALGSCDLPHYAEVCNRVEVVRTAEQLAGVAEELIRSRGVGRNSYDFGHKRL